MYTRRDNMPVLEKSSYKGHTIFKERNSQGRIVYRVQGGISRSAFTTKKGAENAIDRFIKKHNLKR
jgi:hypothetical protein